MKEKIVIIFIALAIGLFLTTSAFYFYNTAKQHSKPKEIVQNTPQQKNPDEKNTDSKTFLLINEPKNESITDKRTIEVKGESRPGNTILVSSNIEDVISLCDTIGNFSAKIEIDSGANIITTRTISQDGEESIDIRIVTYSQEEF